LYQSKKTTINGEENQDSKANQTVLVQEAEEGTKPEPKQLHQSEQAEISMQVPKNSII
jgi:hypothetical protein